MPTLKSLGEKQTNSKDPFEINNLILQPVANGDTYKYLGIDENISYVGEINRGFGQSYTPDVEKFGHQNYPHKTKQPHIISLLSASSLQTFGIIDWTIQELETIDKRTRKILSMNGSFHPNSDIDRLYIPRYQGGRGLKAARSLFKCRIASLYNHLQTYRERNEYMNYVYQQEENETIRVGKELLSKSNVIASVTDTPKQTGKKLLRQLQEEKTKSYKEKMMHCYFRKTIEENKNMDHKESQQWLQDKYLTSHFVAYACAIQEQEIATKYLLSKRQHDEGKTPTINNKCRLCKTNVEDFTHIISACPMMSSRY